MQFFTSTWSIYDSFSVTCCTGNQQIPCYGLRRFNEKDIINGIPCYTMNEWMNKDASRKLLKNYGFDQPGRA